jgi:ribonuclease P protein component
MMSESQPESRKFRPEDRMRRRAEYLRAQKDGRRVHTGSFVLLVQPSEGPTQLGITVTKRVGVAVVRNRVKRLVREVFRLERQIFPAACQVVVVARPSAANLDFAAVRAELYGAERSLQKAAAQLSAKADA